MKWLALSALSAGLGVLAFFIIRDPWLMLEQTFGRRWFSYRELSRRELSFLHLTTTVEQIVFRQVVGALGIALLAVVLKMPLLWVFVPFIVIAPTLWFKNKRNERVTKIETQLDGWILALANSLKASPSLGDALKETSSLMHAPISEELTLLMKEYSLGLPLDQALNSMIERVGSQTLRTAVTTLLIARESGGDLPTVLETTAAALREMARLEGVVRTKTAEGKAQAMVMGAVPPCIFGVMYWLDPAMVRPLFVSATGNIVFSIAIVLWILSVPVAIRVLTVDI